MLVCEAALLTDVAVLLLKVPPVTVQIPPWPSLKIAPPYQNQKIQRVPCPQGQDMEGQRQFFGEYECGAVVNEIQTHITKGRVVLKGTTSYCAFP